MCIENLARRERGKDHENRDKRGVKTMDRSDRTTTTSRTRRAVQMQDYDPRPTPRGR